MNIITRLAMMVMLACISGMAMATDDTNDGLTMDFCYDVHELAETIMSGRQEGVSMSDLYRTADGHALAEHLVILAFEQPKYSGDRMKNETITEFASMAFKECIGLIE